MSTFAGGDREAARLAFAEWAARQAGAPRNAGALVQDVEISHDYAGILSSELLGRRVVWKSVPAPGRSAVTRAPIAIETVDPWSVEAGPLRDGSNHVTICDACGGGKKVVCASCAGIGSVTCRACGGQRKMYGYAANGSRRLLNCTTCRGKGEVDCAGCRRGAATCVPCGGEGRVQRWVELEAWHRAESKVHPELLVRPFDWGETPRDDVIARDAEVTFDVDRPHRLTPADITGVPPQWLLMLAPALQPGERVARQRLRIARVTKHTVRYRLGAEEDRYTFVGRRFVASPGNSETAFGRRASSLRRLFWLLLTIALVVTMLSLGRGLFFWSAATLASLAGLAIALGAIYGAVADWTASRRFMRHWLMAAAGALFIAIMAALIALPSLAHARGLIASGDLRRAERELAVLEGVDGIASAWADLRVAQVRAATTIDAASAVLAQVPRALPQFAVATAALDDLILRTARGHARSEDWSSAAAALVSLSESSRGSEASVAVARAVYLPLVRQKLARTDYATAAKVIADARRLGVGSADLSPLIATMRRAADDVAAEARTKGDARDRLRLRLAAEDILTQWERASDEWGTPPLVELRAAMARDVAVLERAARRRGR